MTEFPTEPLSSAEAIAALSALPMSSKRVTLTLDLHPDLPNFWGSKIEGLIGWLLQDHYCSLGVAPSERHCASCLHLNECEYPALYDPGLLRGSHFGHPPRGLRFQPIHASGTEATFDVTFIGRAVAREAEIITALRSAPGRPFGHQATITALTISDAPARPTITEEQFQRHAIWNAQLLTPTGFEGNGDYAQQLIKMGIRKLSHLQAIWGEHWNAPIDYRDLMDIRFGVRTLSSKLTYTEQIRAHQVTLHGLSGPLTIEFEHSERAWLCAQVLSAAQPFGLGRNAHFGFGHLSLTPSPDTTTAQRTP